MVRDEFKKCGDTGREGATLASRMSGCANTINKIIRGDLTGPFTEHFKSRAPSTIEAGQTIEVWSKAGNCRRMPAPTDGTESQVRHDSYWVGEPAEVTDETTGRGIL